jgi:hypothetical protein
MEGHGGVINPHRYSNGIDKPDISSISTYVACNCSVILSFSPSAVTPESSAIAALKCADFSLKILRRNQERRNRVSQEKRHFAMRPLLELPLNVTLSKSTPTQSEMR